MRIVHLIASETGERCLRKIRPLVLALLCVEVVGASIFFGAVHVWAWSALISVSLVIFLLFWGDKTLRRLPSPVPTSLLALLALFVLSLCLQLAIPLQVEIPVPPSLEASLQYLEVRQSIPSLFSPYYAMLTLYQWLIPIVVLIAVPYSLNSRRDVKVALGALVAIAALQGIYGIVQYLMPDPFPFFARPDKQYRVGGTYICRNTYSCFMAVGFLLAVGCMIEMMSPRRIASDAPLAVKFRLCLLENRRLPWIALVALGAIAMATGAILSLSRAGVILIAGGGISFALLYYMNSSSRRRKAGYALCAISLIAPAIVYGYITGVEPLLTRFAEIPGDSEGRWELSKAAARVFSHHWLLGCGGGSYAYALEIYKPPGMRPYLYAHNDYLQFLAEYGVVPFLCLLAVFALWARLVFSKERCASPLFSPGLWCGCMSALLVFFIHAAFDFSLHVPGHRLTAAFLMGILLAMSRSPGH